MAVLQIKIICLLVKYSVLAVMSTAKVPPQHDLPMDLTVYIERLPMSKTCSKTMLFNRR